MDKDKKKQTIKFWVAIFVLVIIILLVVSIMIRYEVEGDKNMPFNLSKIIVVSTAEGKETEGKNKWNFDVQQNNDVYIYIDKNENYLGDRQKTIDSVKIENINCTKTPAKGVIETYMPNSIEGRLFTNDEEYLVDGSLEYKSAEESNPQTLEIGANGGYAVIRFSNGDLGSYSSDDDDEIIHDGSLLEKIEVTNEDVQFDVSFDLVITVDGINYRGNLTLKFPCGNIIEEGTSSIEITDLSSVVFKRE